MQLLRGPSCDVSGEGRVSTSVVHLKVFRMLNFHTYVMTVLEHTGRRGHPVILERC